jgi:hypothetical protein
MGLHRLPIEEGIFKTKPGKYAGLKGSLKQLVQQGPGVYFIVSCRAITGQPQWQKDQRKGVHYFRKSPSTLGGQIRMQNSISSSLRKRRRISPGTSSKRPKTNIGNLISKMSLLKLSV